MLIVYSGILIMIRSENQEKDLSAYKMKLGKPDTKRKRYMSED